MVLDDGCQAGSGTHEELLASCAVYQEIYYSQFPDERTHIGKPDVNSHRVNSEKSCHGRGYRDGLKNDKTNSDEANIRTSSDDLKCDGLNSNGTSGKRSAETNIRGEVRA